MRFRKIRYRITGRKYGIGLFIVLSRKVFAEGNSFVSQCYGDGEVFAYSSPKKLNKKLWKILFCRRYVTWGGDDEI